MLLHGGVQIWQFIGKSVGHAKGRFLELKIFSTKYILIFLSLGVCKTKGCLIAADRAEYNRR